ncbi:MAG: ABC transporter ATP-binding protein [Thaumarchaeota archaeon]|nr:ABC transporter ATP-binding protein [Nitrososphaerota archaeon]
MNPEVTAISASNLVKNYSSTTSIGPVSLAVEKGTIFGFLGPNGAGKTTTIRMILGLIRPQRGNTQIFGIDPLIDPINALEKVGYAPELPNFQTFFTAEELLDFTARIHGINGAERNRKVKKLLEMVGISDHARKKIGKFSKGMVQRLSVAQALINDPELIIMDEPTIGMDPVATIYFRDLFKEIHSQGKTILVSSHMLDEVQRLCTHIGMIHHGKMVFQGNITDILARFGKGLAIEVELGQITPALVDYVRKLDYVRNLQVDTNKILVTVRDGEDLRAELAEDIVKAGGKLLGLSLKKTTLEDAFIETLRSNPKNE